MEIELGSLQSVESYPGLLDTATARIQIQTENASVKIHQKSELLPLLKIFSAVGGDAETCSRPLLGQVEERLGMTV